MKISKRFFVLMMLFLGFTNLEEANGQGFSKMPGPNDSSVASLFLRLPMDSTAYISRGCRDTLLRFGSDTFKYDTEDVEEYDVEDLAKDYMRYEFRFLSGQAGYAIYELRTFRKKHGGSVLIFSSCGGVHDMYSQGELNIFDVKGSTITKGNDKLLPVGMDIKDFLKEDTPDSLYKKLDDEISYSYDLDPEFPDKIKYVVNLPNYDVDMNKWLKYNCIEFTWDGEKFSSKMVFAQ